MMRRVVRLWTALLPVLAFLTAMLAMAAAESPRLAGAPALAPTATSAAPSQCLAGLQKWAVPEVVELGKDVDVTLVITGDCPASGMPIDLVLLVDVSNSMSKGGLGPGIATPTRPGPPETPGTPTREPGPGPQPTEDPRLGGEPPFCHPERATPTPTRRWYWWTPTPAPIPTRSIEELEPSGTEDQIREVERWVSDFLGLPEIERDMKSDRLRIGVVAFDQRPVNTVALTNEPSRVLNGVTRARGGDITRINNGLREALRVLSGTGSRPDTERVKALMILSDFQFCDADMRFRIEPGVHVLAVGFGVRNFDRPRLHQLATDAAYVSERHAMTPIQQAYVNRLSRASSVFFAGLTVRDELTDTMSLIGGSVNPPTVTISGQVLEWQLPEPYVPATLTFAVQPLAVGRQLISKQAEALWSDSKGLVGRGLFPPVWVEVIAHTPTATATPTSTPTETPSPTPTWTATPRPIDRYLPYLLRLWPPVTPTLTPTPAPTKCVPEVQTVDVALLVDTSTSMNDPTPGGRLAKLQAAIEASIALVDLLKADDQVAVIGFNSTATTAAHLTADKDAVRTALRRLPETQKTGTRIDLGLEAAEAELVGPRHRTENNRSIVLVTDGRQVGPPGNDHVVAVGDRIRASGINVVTIGLGDDVDEELLKRLASLPEYYFPAPGAEDLLDLYRRIARFIPCP